MNNYRIPDTDLNDKKWRDFLNVVGTVGAEVFAITAPTPEFFGKMVYRFRHRLLDEIHPLDLAPAFAHEVHMHEMAIRKKLTSMIHLHFGMGEFFAFFLSSEFGVSERNFKPEHYKAMREAFNAWLATFEMSVLRKCNCTKGAGTSPTCPKHIPVPTVT